MSRICVPQTGGICQVIGGFTRKRAPGRDTLQKFWRSLAESNRSLHRERVAS